MVVTAIKLIYCFTMSGVRMRFKTLAAMDMLRYPNILFSWQMDVIGCHIFCACGNGDFHLLLLVSAVD